MIPPWDLGVVAVLIFLDAMGGDNPQWGYWKESLIEGVYEGMIAYSINGAFPQVLREIANA